jgi:hypothetical protein
MGTSKIKPKRGLSTSIVAGVGSEGEPIFTTNTDEMYLGKGLSVLPQKVGENTSVVDSEIERLENIVMQATPSAIAKTNFVINSLSTSQVKQMNQMYIDTLDDTSGVDITNTRIGYNAAEKKYNASNEQGVVVFNKVDLPLNRKKIMVNYEGNDVSLEYSLNNGTTYQAISNDTLKDISLETGNELKIRATVGVETTNAYAEYFDGVNDYITFTGSIIPLGTKTIKFRFRKWIREATTRRVFANGRPAANSTDRFVEVYESALANGFLIYEVKQGPTIIASATTNMNVCDGEWHDIVFIQNDTTRATQCWVDGVLRNTTNHASGQNDNVAYSRNLMLGACYNSSNAPQLFFLGALDNFEVLNSSNQKVLYAAFEEKTGTVLYDYSGNGNKGTLVGPSVWINNPDNVYRDFNGTSGRIVYSSRVIQPGSKTIEFDFRRSPIGSVNERIFATGILASDACEISVGFQPTSATSPDIPGQIFLVLRKSGVGIYYCPTTINVCDGTWKNIRFVVNTTARSVSVFINGTLNNQVNFGTGQNDDTQYTRNFVIGASYSSASAYDDYFSGNLKNLKITNSSGGIILNAKMDEQQGTTIYDYSGNNNTGTSTGTTGITEDNKIYNYKNLSAISCSWV